MKITGCFIFTCAWLAALSGAPPVVAAPPKVIYSNLASSPTSNVPGMTGWKFRPSVAVDTTLLRFAVSPDGTRWALVGWIQTGTTECTAVVRGSGTSGAGGAVVARVGGASYIGGRAYDALQTGIGINDAGSVLFAGSVAGASGDDGFAARWTNGTVTELAREGQQVPGLPPGSVYGVAIDCAGITSAGAGVVRTQLGGNTTQVLVRASTLSSGVVLAQSGVTTPGSQLFLPPQSLSIFEYNQYLCDGAADHIITRARLNGPSTPARVAMIDNAAVVQSGAAVPGSGFTSAVGAFATYSWGLDLSPSGGHWGVVGSNVDATDWVFADGVVVAATGWPVVPGVPELFDDARAPECFAGVTITSAGTVAVAASTNGDVTGDSIIAIPGERVLLREGDGVDLDGDGALDDGVFVGDAAPGCVVLTDDQRLFAVISLRNSARSVLGVGLVTLDVAICNDIDFNNDTLFPDVGDVADFLAVFGGAACPTGNCDGIDFNRDGLFPDVDDITTFLAVFSGGTCP